MSPLWLVPVVLWLWLIWACAGEWTNSTDYNYGWFVPPLAAYFLWKRRENSSSSGLAQPPCRGRVTAWLVLALALVAVFPLEIVRQTPIHWRPVLWSIGFAALGSTFAVAWLTGGRALLKVIAVPALFMMVGIPWPTFVENALSFPLMQWVARWSVGLLHLLGYPATAAGTTITLPNCTVGVEEACSGLRSLQTALMVGVAAGELAMLRKGPRALLLVSAFVFALLGNQVRVLLLALAGIHGGAAAVTNYHDAAGYVVLAILLAGVGAAAWLLLRLGGRKAPAKMGAVHGPDSAPAQAVRPAVGWALCVVVAGALLAAHAWFWWRGSLAAPPSPPLLAPAESGLIHVDREVPESILGILQPDEYSYIRSVVDGEPSRVIGYHFYWRPRRGNANQLYHRPDACMPGAGWRIDGEVTRENIRFGDRDYAFNVFPLRGPQGPALMLWGSYLNGEPVGIDFNNDVYLGTANLRQFIMTGTRIHSYEVAACILPYPEGQRPAPGAIREFAANVFRPTATGTTAN